MILLLLLLFCSKVALACVFNPTAGLGLGLVWLPLVVQIQLKNVPLTSIVPYASYPHRNLLRLHSENRH